MAEDSGKLKGAKGVEIHHRSWRPEPHADTDGAGDAVVIAHGYAEHGGRYGHVASSLVADGFAVYAPDHRGHGLSGGRRVDVEDFGHYVEDLDRLIGEVKARHPGRTFLIGHSMGGLIAAAYALGHQERLDGLVLSGASVKPRKVSAALNLIARTLAVVAPSAPVLNLPLDRISRDPEVVSAYRADPLVFDRPMAARLAREAVDAQRRLAAGVESITLPLLVMHGGDDAIVDPGDSRWFFEHVGSKDRTLKLYDGLYHEIFNEPERDTVLRDLRSWLRAHRESTVQP